MTSKIDEREFRENPKGVLADTSEKLYTLFEVFNSVEGEFPKSGEPCTFIRFHICNRACSFCDTMMDPDNKPRNFKLEDIIKSVKETRAITFTGGEATLFPDTVVDIIKECIKAKILINYIKIETNGTHLEMFDKIMRYHFASEFLHEYDDKVVICWSPKLLNKLNLEQNLKMIKHFNPRNMVVKLVMDPKIESRLEAFIEEFVLQHGLKGKEKFSMMPLSVTEKGKTTGVIDNESLKLIKKYTYLGFKTSLRLHELLIVR